MTLERPIGRRRFIVGALVISEVVFVGVSKLAKARSAPPMLGPHTDPPGTIVAGLPRRSYRPAEAAELSLTYPRGRLDLQLFRAGPEYHTARLGMSGVPVSEPQRLKWPGGHGTVRLHVGDLPTGLYFARLAGERGRVGSAPFVLKPAKQGGSRILVVLPTNTWSAYNFRNSATWYVNPDVTEVDLTRPFLGGVPPHYHGYDRNFQRWLVRTGKTPDMIADDDLEAVAHGEDLRKLYDLVVFSGHEEYVTDHTFDVVRRYQDLGGNLGFLSANNFFYKVVKHGDTMHGRWRWRDLGRPEAAMIGAQYLNWYQDRYPNKPFVVSGAQLAPWLFEGTGLSNGSTFGNYGIEIDALAPSSPPGVKVLATIPDIFGAGQTAQMTYHVTRRGAQVFDAGVMNFGGSADNPAVGQMLENLWHRLSSSAS